ncbi:protein kinase [Natrinema versiforme JCM 10478]|uniref:Protein kinase n=1 Tax=Natrinema versiforme JCM 10478 TaxID=1227496 RepID=L9YAY6_9EURY|nr:protein kinase [Natrinema versiforme JCM 10478]
MSRREAIATIGITAATGGCLRPELGEPNSPNASEATDDTVPPTRTDPPAVEDPWTFRGRAGMATPPTLAGELLFVGSVDNSLYALDAASGEQRWSFDVGSEPRLVRVAGDEVFVTTSREVYGLDVGSGEERFHADVGANLSRPVVTDDTIYAADDSTFYALDRSDGSEQWSFRGKGTLGYGAAERDGIIVTTDQGDVDRLPNDVSTVYGLDTESGEVLWETPVENDALISEVAFGDGVATVAGRYGLVAGFDAETGAVVWEHSVEKSGNHPQTPITARGRVYFTVGATTYALEQDTGAVVWEARGGGSDVRHRDGRIYVAPNGLIVLGYDADDGRTLFEQQLDPRMETRPPAISSAAIYYVDGGVQAVPRDNEVQAQ